jgi:hypothetical protein
MKKIAIAVLGIVLLWTIDILVYRGGAARTVYKWAASRFDPNFVSGTIKDARVDSGYVILYLSKNRPCDAIAVPIGEFREDVFKAALMPTSGEKLVSVMNIGSSLVGESVSANGRALKQSDGSNFVFVDSIRQVRFKE